MKHSWIKKGVGILFIGLAAITLFGFIVMGLWNSVLAVVLSVSVINFWQALGILLLSKILFGNFPGRKHQGHQSHSGWRKEMQEKWHNMNPDDKENFKKGWKNRCGDWKRNEPATGAGTE